MPLNLHALNDLNHPCRRRRVREHGPLCGTFTYHVKELISAWNPHDEENFPLDVLTTLLAEDMVELATLGREDHAARDEKLALGYLWYMGEQP